MFRFLLIVVTVISLMGCQRSHLEIFPKLDDPELINKKLTVAEMSEDIDALIAGVIERHPNLERYADFNIVKAYANKLKAELKRPMTRVEFYQVIGQLNHTFGDGHSFLIWAYQEWEELKESGFKQFPFEVKITQANKIVLASDYTSKDKTLNAGQEIQAVNGVNSAQLIEDMQRYVGGESIKLRKQIVARRFPVLLWAVYGFDDEYKTLISGEVVTDLVVDSWQSTAKSEADHYYKKLDADTGYILLSHFDISPDEFETFVDDTFSTIKQDKISSLIIDIRQNPGGNTDTVSYISSYLADKEFKLVSSVVEKLNHDNRGWFNYKGSVGEIINKPWDDEVQPINSENRFKGDVYLLVGSVSYSAAIVFATTLQDNDFATLIGEKTGGYANQSAQGNLFNLPNSQLRAYITTRLLVRPSGDKELSHVVPEYPISETQESIRQGVDVALEKAKSLINRKD